MVYEGNGNNFRNNGNTRQNKCPPNYGQSSNTNNNQGNNGANRGNTNSFANNQNSFQQFQQNQQTQQSQQNLRFNTQGGNNVFIPQPLSQQNSQPQFQTSGQFSNNQQYQGVQFQTGGRTLQGSAGTPNFPSFSQPQGIQISSTSNTPPSC